MKKIFLLYKKNIVPNKYIFQFGFPLYKLNNIETKAANAIIIIAPLYFFIEKINQIIN